MIALNSHSHLSRIAEALEKALNGLFPAYAKWSQRLKYHPERRYMRGSGRR